MYDASSGRLEGGRKLRFIATCRLIDRYKYLIETISMVGFRYQNPNFEWFLGLKTLIPKP